MMALLEFVFSGFWVFIGCLILLGGLCSGIAEIIRAMRK
jgi:hypothetical protein